MKELLQKNYIVCGSILYFLVRFKKKSVWRKLSWGLWILRETQSNKNQSTSRSNHQPKSGFNKLDQTKEKKINRFTNFPTFQTEKSLNFLPFFKKGFSCHVSRGRHLFLSDISNETKNLIDLIHYTKHKYGINPKN